MTVRDDLKPPLVLWFAIAGFLLVTGVMTLIVVGRYGGKDEPPPAAAPAPLKPGVDAKKISKNERAFVVAAEKAYGKGMSVDQERNVLTLGHTYCALVGAGYSEAEIVRLYGKSKERQEAKGVDFYSLSQKTLC